MQFKVLQLLVLAEFGKFFEQCVPTDLFQSLLHTTLTLLPKVYRTEYLAEEGELFILADPTILPSPPDADVHEDTSIDPISAPPVVPTLAQSPHLVPPPTRQRPTLNAIDFAQLGRVVLSVLSAASAEDVQSQPSPNPAPVTNGTPLEPTSPT